jgi:hypothetical protein
MGDFRLFLKIAVTRWKAVPTSIDQALIGRGAALCAVGSANIINKIVRNKWGKLFQKRCSASGRQNRVHDY